jgi:hypothetical protein
MEGFFWPKGSEPRCENCGAYATVWADEVGCLCECPRCGQISHAIEGREGFDVIPGDPEMAKVYSRDREAVEEARRIWEAER